MTRYLWMGLMLLLVSGFNAGCNGNDVGDAVEDTVDDVT